MDDLDDLDDFNTRNNVLAPTRTRYVIKKKDKNMIYNPPKVEYSYYQICLFADNGFYHVRKILYNESFLPINTYEKPYPKKKIDKFIEKTPIHKYKIYPTNTLQLISLPDPNQIIAANSSLLT
jgi:hypothetical protein